LVLARKTLSAPSSGQQEQVEEEVEEYPTDEKKGQLESNTTTTSTLTSTPLDSSIDNKDKPHEENRPLYSGDISGLKKEIGKDNFNQGIQQPLQPQEFHHTEPEGFRTKPFDELQGQQSLQEQPLQGGLSAKDSAALAPKIVVVLPDSATAPMNYNVGGGGTAAGDQQNFSIDIQVKQKNNQQLQQQSNNQSFTPTFTPTSTQ